MESMLDDVERLVGQPEGPRVEFKASVPSPDMIARNLAAFANSDGGVLILGVNESSGKPAVQGVDVARAEASIRAALKRIDPRPPELSQRTVTIDGKAIYAVEMPRSSSGPHLVNGQAYVRRGDHAAVVTPDLASLLVRHEESPAAMSGQLDRLATTVARQGELVEQLVKASSFSRQLTWAIFGAVLGTVLGVLATILLG